MSGGSSGLPPAPSPAPVHPAPLVRVSGAGGGGGLPPAPRPAPAHPAPLVRVSGAGCGGGLPPGPRPRHPGQRPDPRRPAAGPAAERGELRGAARRGPRPRRPRPRPRHPRPQAARHHADADGGGAGPAQRAAARGRPARLRAALPVARPTLRAVRRPHTAAPARLLRRHQPVRQTGEIVRWRRSQRAFCSGSTTADERRIGHVVFFDTAE